MDQEIWGLQLNCNKSCTNPLNNYVKGTVFTMLKVFLLGRGMF